MCPLLSNARPHEYAGKDGLNTGTDASTRAGSACAADLVFSSNINASARLEMIESNANNKRAVNTDLWLNEIGSPGIRDVKLLRFPSIQNFNSYNLKPIF